MTNTRDEVTIAITLSRNYFLFKGRHGKKYSSNVTIVRVYEMAFVNNFIKKCNLFNPNMQKDDEMSYIDYSTLLTEMQVCFHKKIIADDRKIETMRRNI